VKCYDPKDLPGFIKHLQLDPKQKFGPIEDGEPVQVFRKHQVLRAVFNAMLDEGVHQDNVVPMLKRWSQTIEKDFYLRNFAYLPCKRVVAVIGDLDAAQPADGSSDESKEMLEYFRVDWRLLIHYYNFMCKRTLSVQQSTSWAKWLHFVRSYAFVDVESASFISVSHLFRLNRHKFCAKLPFKDPLVHKFAIIQSVVSCWDVC
jgi:hypothetical protein